MDEADWVLRPHTQDDIPFLIDSWGSSYYKGTQAYRLLSPKEFHSFHRPIRERFFQRPTATVIVACAKEDNWHILGWVGVEVLSNSIVLQYLYVKAAFKDKGVAQDLINRVIQPDSNVIYTHLTERAAKIISRKMNVFHNFRYLPHIC